MAFFLSQAAQGSFRELPELEAPLEEGAHPPRLGTTEVVALQARGVCVLVSAQLHVGHLRVRVCCVLDL